MNILIPTVLLHVVALSSCWVVVRFRHTGACSPRQFQCRSGACIQATWVCDGDDDCPDNSDEEKPHCSPTCTSTQFTCLESGRCIPRSFVCDGDRDCRDGSDEATCGTSVPCDEATKFHCGSFCIPRSWVCDGESDCLNDADEANCQSACRSDEFKCNSTGMCISSNFKCDGDKDCTDGEDEVGCPKCDTAHNFECENQECIPLKWRCDGDYDCRDHSDEKNCTSHKTDHLCRENEFRCPGPVCIMSSWVCNGRYDCIDASDEANCKNVTCQADEFKCKNNKCIQGRMQCDGKNDCSDGSDEEDCATGSPPPCEEEYFDCGGVGQCIPHDKVCDGKSDCPKGEDEPGGLCGVNECKVENGGCSQLCVDTPVGYHCKCRPGFKLVDNTTCDDIDECEDPSSCSQTCINEKGTFKCECLPGYTKDFTDHRRCKAVNHNASLIFTRRHDIREVTLRHPSVKYIVKDSLGAIALDIHIKLGLIFWSDANDKKIYRANMTNTKPITTIVDSDSTICDGLAVDWVYNHIYWTDASKDLISLATLDGKMTKVIIGEDLDKPRALALNPLEGWMFWSDWGFAARIEKAGMDGTHRQVIVKKDVEWPNGITLDLVKRRLYWIDARLDMISSVNYDGSGRRKILGASSSLVHPFSISIFEDYIYWTDWVNQGIFRANKFNGTDESEVVGSLPSVMVVHVNHPYKQPNGTNYCSGLKCSHICLPSPQLNSKSAKATCSCPEGFRLAGDGKKCVKNIPFTTSESISVPSTQTTSHSTEKTNLVELTTATRPEVVTVKVTPKAGVQKESKESYRMDSAPEERTTNATRIFLGLCGAILLCATMILSYRYWQKYKRSDTAGFVSSQYSRMGDEHVSLTKSEETQ